MNLSTKDHLIQEAQILIQERGYDSFSFQNLADKVGIRKASVHSHFKDKEEMGVRIVEKYRSDFEAWVQYHSQKSPMEKLKSFTKMVFKMYIEKNHLCANGAFFADWGALPESVQNQVILLQEHQIEWIAECLEVARKEKEIEFEGDSILRAKQIFVTIVGAIQAARAWKDQKVFKSILDAQLKDLGWRQA